MDSSSSSSFPASDSRHAFLPLDVRPEPLPGSFEPGLRAVDDLLHRAAARTSMSRAVADAVYDVTVGMIWQRQAPLPMVVTRRSMRETMWSRLSLAAAVAMAFTLALMALRAPATATDETRMAGLLPASVEHILLESGVGRHGSGDLWYLIETRDLDSSDAVFGDLHRLVDEMEM